MDFVALSSHGARWGGFRCAGLALRKPGRVRPLTWWRFPRGSRPAALLGPPETLARIASPASILGPSRLGSANRGSQSTTTPLPDSHLLPGVSQSTASRVVKALTGAIARTMEGLLLTAEDVPEGRDFRLDGTIFPCWSRRNHREL